jgi:hypothetical protein
MYIVAVFSRRVIKNLEAEITKKRAKRKSGCKNQKNSLRTLFLEAVRGQKTDFRCPISICSRR